MFGGNHFDERYWISIFLDNEINERGQLKRGFSTRYAVQKFAEKQTPETWHQKVFNNQ